MSVLFALWALSAPVAAPPVLSLPREYWGEYSVVLADCGTDKTDSWVGISQDGVRFYGSSTVHVIALLKQQDGSIVVFAEHSGEGSTWQEIYQLRLSADGQTLALIHPQTLESDQRGTDRNRCASPMSDLK